MKNRDKDIILHIQRYCTDIQSTVSRFGFSRDVFAEDRDFRNSICMSLMQIGELSCHLSEEFQQSTKASIYWPALKGMRNILAHNYGAVDYDQVWDTVTDDIPLLIKFCESILFDADL